MFHITENDTIGTYFGNEKADSNISSDMSIGILFLINIETG